VHVFGGAVRARHWSKDDAAFVGRRTGRPFVGEATASFLRRWTWSEIDEGAQGIRVSLILGLTWRGFPDEHITGTTA